MPTIDKYDCINAHVFSESEAKAYQYQCPVCGQPLRKLMLEAKKDDEDNLARPLEDEE